MDEEQQARTTDEWRLRVFAELESSPTSSVMLEVFRKHLRELDRPELVEFLEGIVVDVWLSGFSSARLETLRGWQGTETPKPPTRFRRIAAVLASFTKRKPKR